MVFTGTLPVPEPGAASTQIVTVNADCELVVGEVNEVAAVPATEGDTGEGEIVSGDFDSVTGELKPRKETTTSIAAAGTGQGCCYSAYAVQRSFDAANIKLNEYWTEFDWTKNSSNVINWWTARDGGAWHREYGTCDLNGGWYRADHALYRSGGNVGQSYVTVTGVQGYGYRGAFSGCLYDVFYNQYTNKITGTAKYGQWTCSYTFYWKQSFPGWKHQGWCGSGNYGG
jgi:hypothetical protein